MTARYLGIDLAWSERRGSGVCVLDDAGAVLDEDQLPAVRVADWVRHWRGDRSVLALDGPLVVPAGSAALRPVEHELHRRYGRYHAGPFPGGAASTSMRGRDRSPAMALVEQVGSYVVDPTETAAHHRAIEVFPAPSWIELFGLTERIVYKHGRKSQRVAALEELRALLSLLEAADPPMRAPEQGMLERRSASARTLVEWKAVEDIIDARLCAYVAQLWDREGDLDWVVTGEGTRRDGYVVIPSGVRARTCG